MGNVWCVFVLYMYSVWNGFLGHDIWTESLKMLRVYDIRGKRSMVFLGNEEFNMVKYRIKSKDY